MKEKFTNPNKEDYDMDEFEDYENDTQDNVPIISHDDHNKNMSSSNFVTSDDHPQNPFKQTTDNQDEKMVEFKNTIAPPISTKKEEDIFKSENHLRQSSEIDLNEALNNYCTKHNIELSEKDQNNNQNNSEYEQAELEDDKEEDLAQFQTTQSKKDLEAMLQSYNKKTSDNNQEQGQMMDFNTQFGFEGVKSQNNKTDTTFANFFNENKVDNTPTNPETENNIPKEISQENPENEQFGQNNTQAKKYSDDNIFKKKDAENFVNSKPATINENLQQPENLNPDKDLPQANNQTIDQSIIQAKDVADETNHEILIEADKFENENQVTN